MGPGTPSARDAPIGGDLSRLEGQTPNPSRPERPLTLRAVRILVEPGTHTLLNMGDVAMLQVAVERLHELWPEASIDAITESPERLAIHCPTAVPIPAGGRRLWFRDHYLSETLHGLLPRPMSRRLLDGERMVRRRWPTLAEGAIRTTSRLRGANCAPLSVFLETVRDADIVVVAGAGALTDAFAPVAVTMLDVLEMARRNGAVTAFLGQGVGPLSNPRAIARARAVLPTVDLITIRECRSGGPLLATFGVPADRILTTGDDAIELAYRNGPAPSRRHGLGVNLRVARYSGVDDDAMGRLRTVLARAVACHGAEPIAIPISRVPNEDDAATIARVIGDPARGPDPDPPETLTSVIERIARCRVVVTGSYHAAVFALAQGVPSIGLAGSQYYVDKFLGLRDQFGGDLAVVSLGDQRFSERLETAIDEAWAGAEELRPRLLDAAERQVAQSRAAYRRLAELVAEREPRARSDRGGRRDARGFNLDLQDSPRWDERAETAVDLLVRHRSELDEIGSPAAIRVADFGCGNERLRDVLARRLARPHAYQGYDLRVQTPAAIAMDLARELPTTAFDVVFCLGLLEYIEDLEWFLRRLRPRCRLAVVSYVVADAPVPLSRRQRRARGWRSDHTRAGLDQELVRCGFVRRDFALCNQERTGVWVVSSAPRPLAAGSPAAMRHA